MPVGAPRDGGAGCSIYGRARWLPSRRSRVARWRVSGARRGGRVRSSMRCRACASRASSSAETGAQGRAGDRPAPVVQPDEHDQAVRGQGQFADGRFAGAHVHADVQALRRCAAAGPRPRPGARSAAAGRTGTRRRRPRCWSGAQPLGGQHVRGLVDPAHHLAAVHLAAPVHVGRRGQEAQADAGCGTGLGVGLGGHRVLDAGPHLDPPQHVGLLPLVEVVDRLPGGHRHRRDRRRRRPRTPSGRRWRRFSTRSAGSPERTVTSTCMLLRPVCSSRPVASTRWPTRTGVVNRTSPT